MAGRPAFSLLSVVANLERHKIASGEPWVLLCDIQYPGSAFPDEPQEHVRLARYPDAITFDASDGNGAQEYMPFSFEMGDYTVSTTGAVPECEVQASNVLRALQTTIEQYSGLVGADLTLYAVNITNLAGEPDLTIAFQVRQTVSDAKLVHLKLGAASPLRRLFPIHMYRPNFCIWQYNSPELQAKAAADPSFRNPGKQCGYQGIAVTSATANGSPNITVTSATGILAAMAMAGPGIAAGTTVVSISGTNVLLSQNATATASAAALIAGLATCSHTVEGDAGCKAHNNLVRIGTFPGIDTNGAVVAGVE